MAMQGIKLAKLDICKSTVKNSFIYGFYLRQSGISQEQIAMIGYRVFKNHLVVTFMVVGQDFSGSIAQSVALALLITVSRIVGVSFDYFIVHYDKPFDPPNMKFTSKNAFCWLERLGFKYCMENVESTVYKNRPQLQEDGDCRSLHCGNMYPVSIVIHDSMAGKSTEKDLPDFDEDSKQAA